MRTRMCGCRRLIPARAGKTAESARDVALHEAHPRAGGENLVLRRLDAVERGSSPRGRGKLGCGRRLGLRSRLIPARAGKTRNSTRRC